MLRLLIARHGNTFAPGEVVRRVGRGTDLPLSESGQHQAQQLGRYLTLEHPVLDAVYCSTLQRTAQTAELALKTMGLEIAVEPLSLFDEIDYGPDEGKPEAQVVVRLGEAALAAWDQAGIVPPGWQVDPVKITQQWENFAQEAQQRADDQTLLVVTSNGNARFVPEHAVKLSTGAISSLRFDQGKWSVEYTNRQPAT